MTIDTGIWMLLSFAVGMIVGTFVTGLILGADD